MNFSRPHLFVFISCLAVHAIIIFWLSNLAKNALPIQPPQLLSLEMVAVTPPAPQAATEPISQPPREAKAVLRSTQAKPKPTSQVMATHSTRASNQQRINVPDHTEPATTSKNTSETSESPSTTSNQAASAKPQPLSLPLYGGAYVLGNPKPQYPPLSIEENEEGTVLLNVAVSIQGAAQSVTLKTSSRYPRLDRAAISAVKRWRFIPAKRGDEPVPYTFTVPVEFSLKSVKS